MNCLNKNSLEYQTLKKMSGISNFNLESTIQYYLDNFDRYPELDELPGADSLNYFKDQIDLKVNDLIAYTDADKVLQFTGSESVPEANVILNNKFKDLEIKLIPLDDTVLVNVAKRPSMFTHRDTPIGDIDTTKDLNKSKAVIYLALNKFKKLYGINIIPVNSDELGSRKWKNIVDDAKTTSAFVYNNDIYVNVDVATIDSPIHELMHIFLGGMRFTDPSTYFSLIQSAAHFSNLENLSKIYRDRTQSDLLEEAFVTEFAKYISDQDSQLSGMDPKLLNRIMYNVTRNLDTMLMGNYSVRGLDSVEIVNSSIQELAQKVESNITTPHTPDIVNAAEIHRRTANAKSDLLRQGKLEEICD